MTHNDFSTITVALAGNPNVGKSTLFNHLTGLKQHTGNWTGKTVGCAEGLVKGCDGRIRLIDLPGTYSLHPHSREEELAREVILSGEADKIAVVCDATALERNLILVLQTLCLSPNVVLCVNLMDEAKKHGVFVDTESLSHELGIPVVPMSARSRQGIDDALTAFLLPPSEEAFRPPSEDPKALADLALQIASRCVKVEEKTSGNHRQELLDRLFVGKWIAFPSMLLLLCAVLWITIVGANYPSELLSRVFTFCESPLLSFFHFISLPTFLSDLLVLGVWRTVGFVVSVMLPPMAIFFPLFTLLEDFGYLPRVAFNLDRVFCSCRACGKQALTMCMGLGCNAVGVTGCRIIDSPRERLVAILTNSLVPCNGRFPTLILLITLFFVGSTGAGSLFSALFLCALLCLSFLMTFLLSSLLSHTLLRGEASSFTLELPPYRTPQVGKVIVRSILDRTLHCLGRAVAVAAPAGALLYVLANLTVGNASLLTHASSFLDPVGRFFGLDGVILLAFLLGFPANEIVMPIIVMAYTGGGALTALGESGSILALLSAHGWDGGRALCVILFMLFHFPCSTTLLTVKKETGKISWTLLAALLPTLLGLFLCAVISRIV